VHLNLKLDESHVSCKGETNFENMIEGGSRCDSECQAWGGLVCWESDAAVRVHRHQDSSSSSSCAAASGDCSDS
jgi:hypothetical protein